MRAISSGVSRLHRIYVRAYNRSCGVHSHRLQADQIRAAASHRAAWKAPISDPRLDDVLDAVVQSINRLDDISPFGRRVLERGLIGSLSTRLRVLSLAGEPGPLAPLVVIVGPPRTGTTFLQRLMAQDPRARSPRGWELTTPVPAPRAAEYLTDRRIGRSRLRDRFSRAVAPGLHQMHPMGATLPEEDAAILSRGFLAATWCNLLGCDPYFEAWVYANGDANAIAAYRYHRRELGYLQSDFSPSHWVLKSPAHMFGLRVLLDTYPDALVLNTYRDPGEWVPSQCQLLLASRSRIARTDPATLGNQVLTWWGRAVDRMIAARKQSPKRFIDVDYREAVESPIGVIRHIYQQIGLEFDEVCERRMRSHIARDTPPGQKLRRCSLEEFGVDLCTVNDRFASYRGEFGLAACSRNKNESLLRYI
jgi:Sulfotransferase family